MLLSGSYPGAFLINSQQKALCVNSASLLGISQRINTFLSSHFFSQEHHFMTAEHGKYRFKVIFIPLEGLKSVGIVENQTITSS